ncbi:MAG: hypothetical protein ACTSQ8_23185 [Candidatus Helarchaeota archaeon]
MKKDKLRPPNHSALQRKLILIAKVVLILSVTFSWLSFYIKPDLLLNNRYHNLWIHAPSIVEKEETFNITVEVWDEFERLVGGYTGDIQIALESYHVNETGYEPLSPVNWTLLESDFTFTSNDNWGGFYPAHLCKGADNGKKSFTVSISTPGVHYFRVTELTSGDIFRSNPVVVMPNGTAFKKLYWGDIHAHSYYSDGSGNPSQVYEYARDVALLDFAALTDHAEIFPQFSTAPLFNQFQNYMDVTNSFNKKGAFVTLIALEWTPILSTVRSYLCDEHMNFYFKGESMPFVSTYTHFTPDEVYAYIQANTEDQFVSWTHHPLRKDYGSDYAFYNESFNRMIEIYSVHGCGEFVNKTLNPFPTIHSFDEDEHGYSVNDLLRMGRKCGLMASGDSHDGRMGHSLVHTKARGAAHVYPLSIAGYNLGAYPNGLTGLYIDELNRTEVFDALYTRSAIATTWVTRPVISFSINNVQVGQNDSTVIVPNVNTNRTLEITIMVDGVSLVPNLRTNISKVEIFKNSELWRTEVVNDIIYHQTINDSAPITGTNYTHCIQKADGKWYIHERSIKPVDPSTLNTGGADYYYIRMTESSGWVSWMGPIWIQPLS